MYYTHFKVCRDFTVKRVPGAVARNGEYADGR